MDDLLTLLNTSKIFSSLSNRACRKLIPQFEKVELEPGEILYHQGDPSDSIEVVLSGKLETILTTADGENKTVGEIEPGETSGEMGALSGEARSTTVKAVKNTILFRLPRELFLSLCQEYPSVLFAILKPIISRSQKLIETVSTEKFKRHVVFAPCNDDVSMIFFSEKLINHAKGLASIIVISEYSEEFSNLTREQIIKKIEEIKAQNTKKIKLKFLYLVKKMNSTFGNFCFEKAEMLYLVVDDYSPFFIQPFLIEKMNQLTIETKTKSELILLHNKNIKHPQNTINWLELYDFRMHHHIRLHRANDFDRLLRFVRNKAVGLVLSGGGTRGWAHAGAITALLEAGIPIDAIGGTSVGAIVAALYAMTVSDVGTLNLFRKIIEGSRRTVSWINLTWPAISLFNAKGLTNTIHKVFGETKIEDLWLPYFCVTTNLAKNAEAIHQRGSLWRKIRASVSIPGIVPPMLLDGELHFDGGLLNNLPVDVMRSLIGNRSNIVAVELLGYKDENKYDFPPILTFWNTLLSKFGFRSNYKFPRFIDTFLKSLLVGSSVKSQQNSLTANIFVSLDLSRFPMLYSNKKLEDRIINMGYENMMEQIKNMQQRKILNNKV